MKNNNSKYSHIFFDLDRTLWDFDRNSRETLRDLYAYHNLGKKGIRDVEDFILAYEKRNLELWNLYRENKIEKSVLRWKRFNDIFLLDNIVDQELADRFGNDYVTISPQKTGLFPYALESLEYLQKHYKLHLITNGFDEVQKVKIKACGLADYFDVLVTSEACGFKKPDSRIFSYALEKADAKAEESLMIGDDLVADILGARKMNIDQIYFNPEKAQNPEDVTFEINSLKELIKIL